MRRILLATLTLCVGLIGMTAAASAGNLGPTILGQSRSEQAFFCIRTKNLDKVIEIEEKSIAANGSIKDFQMETIPLLQQDACVLMEIKYTPNKVVRTWNGRKKMRDGSIAVVPMAAIESTTMGVIKGQVTQITIYVISYDPPARSE